jgi:hypothetical protein
MVYGDIRALAVPFVLMVAKKGLDAWKAKDSKKPKKAPKAKTTTPKKRKSAKQSGGALDAINAMSSYIKSL